MAPRRKKLRGDKSIQIYGEKRWRVSSQNFGKDWIIATESSRDSAKSMREKKTGVRQM